MTNVHSASNAHSEPVPVVRFDAIDSTNTEAMRRAAAGTRGPLWLRADRQLAGKGRSGRAWASPSGNLSATLLFSPNCEVTHLSTLSFVAGLAVYDAIGSVFADKNATPPPDLCVKWPNDVMIGAAKLAGILIETSVFDSETVVAIGCGMNIATQPPIADRPVTRLLDWGLSVAAEDVGQRLETTMQHWLGVWNNGQDFATIRAQWLQRARPIGTKMSINAGVGETGGAVVTGQFAGVAEDGSLLLDVADGNVQRFHVGDVTHQPT